MSEDEILTEVRNKVQPLTEEQMFYFRLLKNFSDKTICNANPVLIKLNDNVDLEKYSRFLFKLRGAHPALLSVVEEEKGVPVQRYVPELNKIISIEKISYDELMNLDLIQPFKMSEPLCIFRLFETDKGKYFFSDFCHVVFDGISSNLAIGHLLKIYADDESNTPDLWLSYLKKREEVKLSSSYADLEAWYNEKYGGIEWTTYPQTDFPEKPNVNEEGFFSPNIKISKADFEILRKARISRNEFFTAVSLIATKIHTQKNNIMISWMYKGRVNREEKHIIGLMLRILPVAIKFEKMPLSSFFNSVKKQVKDCLAHLDYPYTSLTECKDYLCLIYQSNIISSLFESDVFEDIVNFKEPQNTGSMNIFDIQIGEGDDGVEFLFDYRADRYKNESIRRFAKIFTECTKKLLDAVKNNTNPDVIELSDNIFNEIKYYSGEDEADDTTLHASHLKLAAH